MSLKLPIGIQSFEKIRSEGYVYVDKTPFISELVPQNSYYFLSRPRRFGKSLLIDTLYCAFSGKRELFNGLFLDTPESGWDWTITYPVLRIDWSISSPRSAEELRVRIHEILSSWAQEWNCNPPETSIGGQFAHIIKEIHAKTGRQVVVLVDEYDKPILDNITVPSRTGEIRDILRDFYGVLKPLDSHLKFVFLTGVTKFVKTGIFSGLNNLKDISLDSRFSAICGYTQSDLGSVFYPWIIRYNQDQVRDWYNGYSWAGETVYNPFDILLFFDSGVFRPYWFETGTPAFLISLWQSQPRIPAEFDGMIAGDDVLGSFDPEHIRIETLLFQAGYLTVKSWTSDPVRGFQCVLGYPNTEVRTSLNLLFSEALSGYRISDTRNNLYHLLENGDIEGLYLIFHSFFASIPYEWYRKNEISEFEGYYASIVYTYMASLGYEVIPEDMTNAGRIDLTVKTRTGIWIFEFKVQGVDRSGDTNPLEQIRMKRYADKYRSDPRPIHEIGIVFNPKTRNIDQWLVGTGNGAAP